MKDVGGARAWRHLLISYFSAPVAGACDWGLQDRENGRLRNGLGRVACDSAHDDRNVLGHCGLRLSYPKRPRNSAGRTTECWLGGSSVTVRSGLRFIHISSSNYGSTLWIGERTRGVWGGTPQCSARWASTQSYAARWRTRHSQFAEAGLDRWCIYVYHHRRRSAWQGEIIGSASRR